MSENVLVRGTAPGELCAPMGHFVLEGETQGLCGTWVSEDEPGPGYDRCVVCWHLGLAYLHWLEEDLTF